MRIILQNAMPLFSFATRWLTDNGKPDSKMRQEHKSIEYQHRAGNQTEVANARATP
jgi:hypothetical protein